MISEARQNPPRAKGETIAEATRQHSRTHFMRDVQTTARKKHQPTMTAALQTVFAPPIAAEIRSMWDGCMKLFRSASYSFADMMAMARGDLSAVHHVPARTFAERLIC